MAETVSDDLVAEVTARINETLAQLSRLPPKARDAAVMTTILALTEKLLVHGVNDVHMNYLMLMSGMTDVYHGIFGHPPNRTLQ